MTDGCQILRRDIGTGKIVKANPVEFTGNLIIVDPHARETAQMLPIKFRGRIPEENHSGDLPGGKTLRRGRLIVDMPENQIIARRGEFMGKSAENRIIRSRGVEKIAGKITFKTQEENPSRRFTCGVRRFAPVLRRDDIGSASANAPEKSLLLQICNSLPDLIA